MSNIANFPKGENTKDWCITNKHKCPNGHGFMWQKGGFNGYLQQGSFLGITLKCGTCNHEEKY